MVLGWVSAMVKVLLSLFHLILPADIEAVLLGAVAGFEVDLAKAADQVDKLLELLLGLGRRQSPAKNGLGDKQVFGRAEIGGEPGAVDVRALRGGTGPF